MRGNRVDPEAKAQSDTFFARMAPPAFGDTSRHADQRHHRPDASRRLRRQGRKVEPAAGEEDRAAR